MSITDENTVMILGAGVSAPFGVPLGGSLIPKLTRCLYDETSNWFSDSSETTIRNNSISILNRYFHDRSNYIVSPICFSVVQKYELTDSFDFSNYSEGLIEAVGNDLRRLAELKSLLSNQTSDTIDDFIVENPSYSSLVKIGIASEFLKSCYKQSRPPLLPNEFERRHLNFGSDGELQTRNWIHLLINLIRHGVRSGEVSEHNKIQIITFNYDMILEYVLDQQFSNTELKHGHYKNFIDILHVHGQCGPLNGSETSSAKTIVDWANGIHVVGEKDAPEEIKGIRLGAKNLVLRAKEIYACGFAFSGPNCRLLGLSKDNSSGDHRSISFCNYDGDIGLRRKVFSFEKTLKTEGSGSYNSTWTTIQEAPGTKDQPMEVHDWLRLGYLGELPA